MRRLNIGCGGDIREGYVNFDKRDLPGVDVVGDATELPFDENEFDLVVAQDVLEHFWDQQEVLEEWKRVTALDGMLAVRVPNWDALKDDEVGGDFNFENLEKAIYGGHKNEYDQHHRLYTKDVLRERLYKSGFKQAFSYESTGKPVHWHLIGLAAPTVEGTKHREEAIDELTRTVD